MNTQNKMTHEDHEELNRVNKAIVTMEKWESCWEMGDEGTYKRLKAKQAEFLARLDAEYCAMHEQEA